MRWQRLRRRDVSADEEPLGWNSEESENFLPRLNKGIQNRLIFVNGLAVVLGLIILLYFGSDWSLWGSATMLVVLLLVCVIPVCRHMYMTRKHPDVHHTRKHLLLLASCMLLFVCFVGAWMVLGHCYIDQEEKHTPILTPVAHRTNTTSTIGKDLVPRERTATKSELVCPKEHGYSFAFFFILPCELLVGSCFLYLWGTSYDFTIYPRLPHGGKLFMDNLDCLRVYAMFFDHAPYLVFDSEEDPQKIFGHLFLVVTFVLWFFTILQHHLEFSKVCDFTEVRDDEYEEMPFNWASKNVDEMRKNYGRWDWRRSFSLNCIFLAMRIYLRVKAAYSSPIFMLKNGASILGMLFEEEIKSCLGVDWDQLILQFVPLGQNKGGDIKAMCVKIRNVKDSMLDLIDLIESSSQPQDPKLSKMRSKLKAVYKWAEEQVKEEEAVDPHQLFAEFGRHLGEAVDPLLNQH